MRLALAVLLTLADLLDDRMLLLAALVFASGEVVLMESASQAVTWGFRKYAIAFLLRARSWIFFGLVCAICSWLLYVFPMTVYVDSVGLLSGLPVQMVFARAQPVVGFSSRMQTAVEWLLRTGVVAAAILYRILTQCKNVLASIATALEMALSWGIFWLSRCLFLFLFWLSRCLPSQQSSGSFYFALVSTAWHQGRGERTRERQDEGVFCHYYHESCIPSCNLLLPSVDSWAYVF